MSICQAILGGYKLWVGFNRLPKVLRGLPFFLITGTLAIPVQVKVALKVWVQRFGIDLPELRHRNLIRCSESSLNLPCNIFSHVSFQCEDVTHVSFVTFGPKVLVRGFLD